MTQYLSEIKILMDQIVVVESIVNNEDITLYILNGLPPSYQSFKTDTRIMLTPISLDQLYPLLLSKEINLGSNAAQNSFATDHNVALYSFSGCSR